MALGARAILNGCSVDGENYRITIYEDGYAGSSFNLNFALPMFTLSYKPEVDDIASLLVPSFCEIYFYNENDNADDLLSDIIEYQQSGFYVLIEKEISSTYEPYWRGVIMQDEIIEVEESKPSVIKLSATDGLSLLKGVDYDFANVDSNPSRTNILKIIENCLSGALPQEMWSASEEYLITSTDWWEDSQTYVFLDDPLAEHDFDVEGFSTSKRINFQGGFFTEYTYMSCYEVLKEIAKLYLSRIYQSNGAFYFEQLPMREDASVKRCKYDKALTELSIGAESLVEDIDGTRGAALADLNQYTYLPALKKVTVEQATYASSFAEILSLDTDDFADSTSKDYGIFDTSFSFPAGTLGTISQAITLNIEFEVEFDWDVLATDYLTIPSGGTKPYLLEVRPKFDLIIKLSDIYSADEYWWDGSAWQTSDQTITVKGDIYSYRSGTKSTSVVIQYRPRHCVTKVLNTSNLPATGRIEISMSNYDIEKRNGYNPTTWTNISSSDFDHRDGTIDLTLKSRFDRNDTIMLFSVINPDAQIADNEIYDYGQLKIGDAAMQTGNLMIDTGSVTAATLWSVGNTTANQSIAALLAQQRLALQSAPVVAYDGEVWMARGFQYALRFDSTIYLSHEHSFNAYTGRINGTWFKVGMSGSLGTPTGDLSGLNMYRNISFNDFGRVLNEITEKTNNINSLDDDFVISTNVTFGGAFRGTTETFEAVAGNSDAISDNTYNILITWSDSTTGTFTLDLPSASDFEGYQLHIFTDGNFDEGKILTLDAAGAEEIQGSGTKDITGNYQKVTLTAIDGNWY